MTRRARSLAVVAATLAATSTAADRARGAHPAVPGRVDHRAQEHLARARREHDRDLRHRRPVGLARIDADGTFTNLTDKVPASREAHDTVTDAAGNIWVSETAVSKVARIAPNGTVTEFPLPTSSNPPRSPSAPTATCGWCCPTPGPSPG